MQIYAKEACSSMSKPREKDWTLLRRMARYLIRAPELVIEYKFEESCDEGIVMHREWLGLVPHHSSIHE